VPVPSSDLAAVRLYLLWYRRLQVVFGRVTGLEERPTLSRMADRRWLLALAFAVFCDARLPCAILCRGVVACPLPGQADLPSEGGRADPSLAVAVWLEPVASGRRQVLRAEVWSAGEARPKPGAAAAGCRLWAGTKKPPPPA
jgi:hypothetical protein